MMLDLVITYILILIYTEKGGWIDMAHLMFYAGLAYNLKLQNETILTHSTNESYKIIHRAHIYYSILFFK